ncbi:hypothetical protein BG006_010243 [Podila minutissima]|uniref:Leucine rich repeat protein n=1 Tax=Podila minutissima TaxID=64525 RepID=A0A9P5VRB5_9FUNG|nr:hypothetical protein BG006_010243 [Podila minutissima]
MAAATHILHLSDHPSLTIHHDDALSVNQNPPDEAIYLANICRPALNDLALHLPWFNASQSYTAEEILALPLTQFRIPDALRNLPSRRSTRGALAKAIAALLHPVHEGSLTAVIRYEADRVRLRALAVLQHKYDQLQATRRNGRAIPGVDGKTPGALAPVWTNRIRSQGPWDPEKKPVSLGGVRAIPMPVKVAEEEHLTPFLAHLSRNGTHLLDKDNKDAVELNDGKGEPYYGVKGAEFPKGVIYEDGRMDLCKMVVGPDHIWSLMDSLRPNEFVQQFLLGNNIIGPSGAQAITNFIHELPSRMDTWYLAGNCIDGLSFKILVDAMVKSPSITNVWMKRNPLGADAAPDVFRLITETVNLRTLDLDQTELGDKGVTNLFNRLSEYTGPEGSKLPLRHIYLNGCGISTSAAKAIGKFLESPHCGLTSIYMSANPLGNQGVEALAAALPKAPHLIRLFLQSVGVSTQGAVAVCSALAGHPSIRALDLSQAYTTQDLGQAYNYIEDEAVPTMLTLLQSTPQLEYFNLGHCAITPPGLIVLSDAVTMSQSLLHFSAASVVADPTRQTATFMPSRDVRFPDPTLPTRASIEANKAVHEHLKANVRAQYGHDVSYEQFMAEEKRWLVNDRDVRKIDSVYRNRDARLARQQRNTLVKDWEEGDDTLERVMAHAPLKD